MPERRTFRPRWKIPAITATGITEAHRHEAKTLEIVKCVAINTEPVAQAITAGIVPGNAGGVNACSGRLSGDDNARSFINTDDRSRAQRQMCSADGATSDFAGEQTEFSPWVAWAVLVYHSCIMASKNIAGKPVVRCSWADRTPLEIIYHDKEWGVPQHDDRVLFEFLILEGAQAGLSWSTVLAKREGYRAAFDNFDVPKIARYTDAKLEKLMQNPAIVRNKLKIASARTNAKAFIEVQKEFGSFSAYYWGFVNNKPIVNHPKSMKDVPARTELSDRISKDLLKRGFKFVGSTIIYAYMQATGMVNDHLTTCDCYKALGRKKA